MDNNFNELLDAAKSFDTTGLGRLNLVVIKLAEVGLRTMEQETACTQTNSLEVFTAGEVAKMLKISVRTLCDYRKEFGIEPDWGRGRDARYTRATVEQIQAKMKERIK